MKKYSFILFIAFIPAWILAQPRYELMLYEEFTIEGKPNAVIWNSLLPWVPGNVVSIDGNQCFIENNVNINNGYLELILKDENMDCEVAWQEPNCKPCNLSCMPDYDTCYVQYWATDSCLCKLYKNYNYTSGAISSKQRFLYGKFEMRAKLSGDYSQPAFWLMDGCAKEIDIVDNGEGINTHLMNVLQLSNCQDANSLVVRTSRCSESDLSGGFHIYTLEWTPYQLTWYLDGKIQFACSKDSPYPYSCLPFGSFPDEPMSLILNTSAGWRNLPPTGLTPPFSDTMKVDYVKVWKFNGESTVNGCSDTLSSVEDWDKNITGNIITPENIIVKKSITFNNVTVIPGIKGLYYSAGDYIEFQPGFITGDNVELTAEIKDCLSKKELNTICQE